MPIVEPRYWPAPKSACMKVPAPMKLMTAAELGSTGVEEISAFQRLSAGNGTKPPRLAPWPGDREYQEHDTEIEHFAHVCRHAVSNAIQELAYRTVPSGDTGLKGSRKKWA